MKDRIAQVLTLALIGIMVLAFVLLLRGCNVDIDYGPMVEVENSAHYEIFVDRNTRVMYYALKSSYPCGITVMVNPDGSPMIWNGDI